MTSAWFFLIGLWIVTAGIMYKRYCTQSRIDAITIKDMDTTIIIKEYL